MFTKFKDITGQRFGKLLAIKPVGKSGRAVRWLLKCDCGNEIEKKIGNIGTKKGQSISCGCAFGRRKRKAFSEKHGHTNLKTPEYQCWRHIYLRCYVKSHCSYENYGGRGITMSESWRNSFRQFLSDMGNKPSPQHSIDRIDSSLGYNKENCRWATLSQQANNRRDNVRIEYKGRTMTIAMWERETKLPIRSRIKTGWTVEDAFSYPMHSHRPKRYRDSDIGK